jgi:DNA-binding transcriptional LysR family regulator
MVVENARRYGQYFRYCARASAGGNDPAADQQAAKPASLGGDQRQCPLLPPPNINRLDEQPQIRVDDFASKVALLRAGLGCGFLPRHIAWPWLENGELVEKAVISYREKDIAYMACRSGNDGLAQRWWREAILQSERLSQLYG